MKADEVTIERKTMTTVRGPTLAALATVAAMCGVAEAPPCMADDGNEHTSVPQHARVSKFLPRASHPARNSVCPCGSGKKFKKCCLQKGTA